MYAAVASQMDGISGPMCLASACCAVEASSQRVHMNGGNLICGPHWFAIGLIVPYTADTYLHPVSPSELCPPYWPELSNMILDAVSSEWLVG